ncbi:hypothetical protein L0Y65_02250 [Candidatus Micrarchaeota archaeon]|nr:hypothetical protein [Candidatus Micrarchaeota archaeon]
MPPVSMEELEGKALDASNRIITSIESLMAAWELAADKPQEFASDIHRLQHVHQCLTEWERRMLKRSGKMDADERMLMLRQFSRIFEPYKRGW